ncbi:hypothetical protein MXB_1017 [Myxobolus squamalis]|nr:hypothetical protein MXB_1017 [Myxobolus squamalis]
MDLTKKATYLILQFLDEHSYKNTLKELIHESGVDYDHYTCIPSGKLLSLIGFIFLIIKDNDKETNYMQDNNIFEKTNSDLLKPGDNVYANTELVTFHAVGGGSNVLISALNSEGGLPLLLIISSNLRM